MPEEILIVGTGALACLFAVRLAAQGVKITMLGTWREGLAALRQHGVTEVQIDGRQTSYPVIATDDPADCANIPYALVLVKSWQTQRAAEQLAICLPPNGLALTLQNGLGNLETLETLLGKERVALGVTTTGATLLSSGRVRPGGEGIISLGEHPKLQPLCDLLDHAGFSHTVLENIDSLIWSKLVINAAINPITALIKIKNGEILHRASARQLSADLALEVAAVAQAQNITLSYPDPIAAAEKVAEKTNNNFSSMYQDILRGAPTEINAICGAVNEIGNHLNIPTPVNYTIWKLIHAIVEGQKEKNENR